MKSRSRPRPTTAKTVGDLRRGVPRATWLANRANNALQRPVFIGAISVATFVTALVSMVVAPRTQSSSAQAVVAAPRPDTLTVAASSASARQRVQEMESALATARMDLAAAEAAARLRRSDTLFLAAAQMRDSLESRIRLIEQSLARAEQAPLPSSYRAVADLVDLRADPRIRPLLDSLSDIERERDGFGSVGGVDPIFVALTSRANEIGRVIQAIAAGHRNALRATLDSLAPVQVVEAAPSVDTAALIATRDSAKLALDQATADLSRLRAQAFALDLADERARERAAAVAPPLALLASAFVLSGIIGFAAAFFGEVRRPRVSDASELERLLGIRVLSTVEASMPSVDRGRREADRSAPPYFDPGAEGYQLAYLGLATEHATELMATVTGDDPAIAAVVACNLAAIAADEARNTLVVDLEQSCSASAALRSRVKPGILDILDKRCTWPDATVAARVGRDKTIDLVPQGGGKPAPPEQLVSLLRQDAERLARYYDAVLFVASVPEVVSGVPAALPSPEVLYCARPGVTSLRLIREDLEKIRSAGGLVRGVVLWSAERPMLPTPQELEVSTKRARTSEPRVAVATR